MSVPQPPPVARTGSRWPLMMLALLAVIGVIVVFLRYDPFRFVQTEIPAIATDSMEPPVAALVERVRTELANDPGPASAWGQVGLALFANDRPAESRIWFEHAQQRDPRDPRWPYFQGLVRLTDRPDEAVDHLRRACELAPADAALRLRLAETLLRVERDDEAEAAFIAVQQAQSNLARADLGRGRILLRRGDAAAAVPLLSRAAAHPTARKSARVALAEAQQRLGNESGAAEQRRLATEALDDAPWDDPRLAALADLQVTLSARLRRADALIGAQDFRQAMSILDQVLRDHPDSADAHYSLGKILIRVGRPKEAEAILQKAITLDPTMAAAYARLADAHNLRGDTDGAEKHLRKALELRPADALTHYNLAQCRLLRGDKASARASLQDAIRYQPNLAPAHLALGDLHLEAGRVEDATACLEAAAKLEPQNEKVRKLLEQVRTRTRK